MELTDLCGTDEFSQKKIRKLFAESLETSQFSIIKVASLINFNASVGVNLCITVINKAKSHFWRSEVGNLGGF